MGTRVAAATRRQLILDSAAELFHRQPYHDVTTKALAAAAGVSEALVLQHFGTKHDLYVEVVQAGVEDLTARLEALVTAAVALPEASIEHLEHLFSTYLDAWFADPGLLRTFLLEPSADGVRRTYYQVLLDQEAAMLPALEQARATGLVPDIDPRVLLRALIGQTLVFVVTEEWLGGKDLGPLDRTDLAHQLAVLWSGLLGTGRASGAAS